MPGFPAADGFHEQEKDTMALMRSYMLKTNNMPSNTKFPVPAPPVAIPGVSPFQLRWRGSVWAASFAIYRGTCSLLNCATPDGWTLIATNIMDNVPSGTPIYRDGGAVPGQQYWYWIFPVGVDGTVGQGTQIGPLVA